MPAPLRLPAFRLLFAARAISYIGTYLAPIAVAFAILDLGGGATAVGLGFAAWTLAQLADSGDDVNAYGQAMPFWQSYRGLARWAEKRAARLSAGS